MSSKISFIAVCGRAATFSAALMSGAAALSMDLGPTTVTSAVGQPFVAEVEVRNVKEQPTWSLQAGSVSRADYLHAGLSYAPVLDSTNVKLRRRPDGSRFLLVSMPQALPAGVDDVLLNVTWDNKRQAQSYRLINGATSVAKTTNVAATAPPVATAVVATPLIAASAQPLVGAVTHQRLQERVAAWAMAWERKDIDAYLGMYDQSFNSDNHATRSAWERERRQRIAPRDRINVDVSAMVVNTQGARGSVEFTQRYASGVYSDVVRKRLDFVERGGELFITDEAVVTRFAKGS